MTTSNGPVADVIEGIVEARNDRGIRVGGEWRNLSKFHPLEFPGQGARVRLDLDGKGFIKTLQVLDAAPVAGSSDRDRVITRLAVLQAAATFAGGYAQSREEVRSSDVLKIADAWLRWVEDGDQS